MKQEPTNTGEIERELEQTRSRLDATIGALQQKLAPGPMVDQAIEYFREGGGVEFGRNLGRSVRDNPIPVALIGVGIGWLVWSNSRQGEPAGVGRRDQPWTPDRRFDSSVERGSYGRYRPDPPGMGTMQHDLATKAHRAGVAVQREVGDAEDAFQDRVHAARGRVLGLPRDAGEAADGFHRGVEDARSSAAERVRTFASDVVELTSQLAERGQATARDLYDYGASAASDARDRAGSAMGQMRDMGNRTVDYVQDQPLLLGALGVTVGAAIGLLLPASHYERRLAGSLRDSLGETARQMAGDAGQSVARVAVSVLDTANELSRREGLIGGEGQGIEAASREKVADVAARTRQVVDETAAAGREAIEREMSANNEAKAADVARGRG